MVEEDKKGEKKEHKVDESNGKHSKMVDIYPNMSLVPNLKDHQSLKKMKYCLQEICVKYKTQRP